MMYRNKEIATQEHPTLIPKSKAGSQINLDGLIARDPGKRAETSPQCQPLEGFSEDHSLQGVQLATLVRFDTLAVHTANSHYRMLLLDPDTGRALLEGGGQITGPIEVRIMGSSFGGIMLRTGCICVGLRMEACANDVYIRTSPVQSLRVGHQTSPELTSSIADDGRPRSAAPTM